MQEFITPSGIEGVLVGTIVAMSAGLLHPEVYYYCFCVAMGGVGVTILCGATLRAHWEHLSLGWMMRDGAERTLACWLLITATTTILLLM